MTRPRFGVAVLVGLWLVAPSAWATTYAIDKDHTTVAFKIRHLFSKSQFSIYTSSFWNILERGTIS